MLNSAKQRQRKSQKIPHEFDRKNVKAIKCNLCLTIQTPAKHCINCNVTFGHYFCIECALWDNDTSKHQFHCKDCGVCKTGGRRNFFHCDTCGTCVSKAVKDQHKHETEKFTPCSMCSDNLAEAESDVMRLKCGHKMHRHCFKELTLTGETCPECDEKN